MVYGINKEKRNFGSSLEGKKSMEFFQLTFSDNLQCGTLPSSFSLQNRVGNLINTTIWRLYGTM